MKILHSVVDRRLSWDRMNFLPRVVLALFAISAALMQRPASAQPTIYLGGSYGRASGIALDQQGNVYVADDVYHAVTRLSPTDGYLTQTTLAPNLGPPKVTAIDRSGNLFIGNRQGGVVLEVSAASGYTSIKTVSTGVIGYPVALAVDANENLYVADGESETIIELVAASGYGTARTIAGGFGGLAAIALDSSGDLFALDGSKQAVSEIFAVGGVIPDAPTIKPIRGTFSSPYCIAIDSANNLFVGSLFNQIVEVLASGQYSTSVTLSPDTQGTTGIAIDGANNLYVIGISGTGVFTEIVASGGYTQTHTVGSGPADPIAISADSAGNVFVTDDDFAAVREFPAGASTATVVFSGFNDPTGLAIDRDQNVFLSDSQRGLVLELLAADGYSAAHPLGSGFKNPSGLALDSAGNLFVADRGNATVKEIFVAGGYTTVKELGAGFTAPLGVALDSQGNVFVADGGSFAVPYPGIAFTPGTISEITAASGYATVTPLASADEPAAVVIDSSGNVFYSDVSTGLTYEITKSSNYEASSPLSTALGLVDALAIDPHGDLFAARSGSADYSNYDMVEEILMGPPAVAASVLPAARTLQTGKTTTIFATMINLGQASLENCRIALPAPDAYGLTLDYQTTDPSTNTLIGSPNKPVTLPPTPGAQSFLVALNYPP
jgi:sugar lactone lactonase YvrE